MGNLVVKDNALIEASHKLSEVEQRLILLAILKAREVGDKVEELKDIQSFKTYQFRLPENKVDVVISGLGFVTIHCPNALIEVKAPEQVGVFIREALI